jgi:phage terminase small subunit
MAELPATQSPTRSAYDRLPRRLKRFVDEYVVGATGADALRKAGYRGLHPNAIAWKWAKKPHVAAAIEEAQQRLVADVGVRQVTVLKQMHAIATSDPRRVEDENGNTIPLHKLDPETAAAIASVEIEDVSKDGYVGKRYKYKFWDKVKANDRLGQFTKLWEARATNVNVDARSVTLNVGTGVAEALRVLDGVGREIAAIGSTETAALPDPNGPVLLTAVRDGQGGYRASVDAGESAGDSEPA